MSLIDPTRAEGAFLYALTQLTVTKAGLAPGHMLEIIDVTAALAATVKAITGEGVDVDQLLLHRLACATLDLLSTAFMHTDDDRAIVATWLTARSELLRNRLSVRQSNA